MPGLILIHRFSKIELDIFSTNAGVLKDINNFLRKGLKMSSALVQYYEDNIMLSRRNAEEGQNGLPYKIQIHRIDYVETAYWILLTHLSERYNALSCSVSETVFQIP